MNVVCTSGSVWREGVPSRRCGACPERSRRVKAQDPQIGARGGYDFPDDQPRAIRRDRDRVLGVGTRGQALDGPRVVGRLPEEVGDARAGRREDDAPAVRRPDRDLIVGWRIRQPRQRLAREIPDPEVVLLIANVERHPRAVRREARKDVGARRRGRQGLLAAVPRDPHERPRDSRAAPGTYTSAPVRETLNAAAPVASVVTRSTTGTGSLPTSSVTGSKRTARSVPATA